VGNKSEHAQPHSAAIITSVSKINSSNKKGYVGMGGVKRKRGVTAHVIAFV